MKLRHFLLGLGVAGAGLLAYGALVEARRLVVERRTLRLRGWPERLAGFRIAVLADLHIRNASTAALAREAVELALDEQPDMAVLPGDIVDSWKPETAALVGEALSPLILLQGNAVAIPGNREHRGGTPELLRPILDDIEIKLLVNEAWRHAGITWIGIDSANRGEPDPVRALNQLDGHGPVVALWHEPDLVDVLPPVASLMIAGHSHGGQFRTPWGWPPMRTENGSRYLEGFFPDARTPLYVSRGVGTTFLPSRLFCPPEVSLLTLTPDSGADGSNPRGPELAII